MLKTFRERLVWLRSVSGALTLSQMSILAGLSRNHLGLLESGQRYDPDTTTIEELARVYGVSMDWLWRGIGNVPSPEHVRTSVLGAQKRGTKRNRKAAA